jgi:hypothetical protein
MVHIFQDMQVKLSQPCRIVAQAKPVNRKKSNEKLNIEMENLEKRRP